MSFLLKCVYNSSAIGYSTLGLVNAKRYHGVRNDESKDLFLTTYIYGRAGLATIQLPAHILLNVARINPVVSHWLTSKLENDISNYRQAKGLSASKFQNGFWNYRERLIPKCNRGIMVASVASLVAMFKLKHKSDFVERGSYRSEKYVPIFEAEACSFAILISVFALRYGAKANPSLANRLFRLAGWPK